MSSESNGSVLGLMEGCFEKEYQDKRESGERMPSSERTAHTNVSLSGTHERSCGAIVFKKMKGELRVLVIQHGEGHWSFPKGHMERGESEFETAIREVREETGIEIEITSNFRGESTYSPRKGATKTVTFFIGNYLGGDIQPQESEIYAVHWMRPSDAVPLLTFDKDRSIFIDALEHYLVFDRVRTDECCHRGKGEYDRDCASDTFTVKERYTIDELLMIMAFLRSDKGCPWDRIQTHESIKGNLIEEAYEVVDAIGQKDTAKLCEELGDVMMQVVFHAQIADEAGAFTFEDVVSGICRKLISRHTHLFGDDVATTPDVVLDTWEKNKRKEKGHESIVQELKDVPISLPALMRSFKLQKRAARIGFDWPTIDGARAKIAEETKELFDEVSKVTYGDVMQEDVRGIDHPRNFSTAQMQKQVFDEAGDLLFAVVNVLRILKVDPEAALNATSDKFIRRFEIMNEFARQNSLKLEEMSLHEMDQLWNEAKKVER